MPAAPRIPLALGIMLAAAASLHCRTTPDGQPLPQQAPTQHTPAQHTPARKAHSAVAEAPRPLTIGATQVELVHSYIPPALTEAELRSWSERRLRWVADYYGKFPVPTLRLEFVKGRGQGISFGQAFEGREIHIYLGPQSQLEDIADDWVFVHEMLHLGFPYLDRRHRWMREGLSTYLEPLIRARVGNLSPAGLWQHFHEKMAHGRPKAGDQGLDHTHTWANTYWGGALFWLALDVEIRRQSRGQQSIDNLLRALADAGMDARNTYEMAALFPIAERALASKVFEDSYRACADRPLAVNLDALWAQLGVKVDDSGQAQFDSKAPLAGLRRAMTER